MFIFFGTRSTKLQSQQILEHTQCPYCSTQNNFIVTTFGTYFHVFWIPMFSIGTKKIIECTHCKKTYSEKEVPEDIKEAMYKSLSENPPKKSYWHCAGCFVILAAMAMFFLLLIYALIFKAVKDTDNTNDSTPIENVDRYEENKEEDRIEKENKVVENFIPEWEYQLLKDMRNTDYSPAIESNMYSYALKLCLDAPSLGLEDVSTGYFVKKSEDKMLILLESEILNKLSKEQKTTLYKKIDTCMDSILGGSVYKRYIGVFTEGAFAMVSNSEGVFTEAAAQKDKLKKFYITE